ncbi:LytTR family DNA-binding domain-containing protein [Mucilaginibacter sp.]|uniref:LytR/AlgR family response regulator transcription factor n=1 Tax=Mucilaginibacter sp. TaxID=1882438 RepID=UPI0028427047|nr:LytTR family DNA-binding domain-containing protein [Mucilaginibacter sp.]MDR3695108.1 LytTR family DNA-binding domain-containing protein [Mucilaginibacter sp.]
MSSIHVVIIEDEPVSARNLAHLLNKLDDSITIKTILNSVEESVTWFNSAGNDFDLVFMDIRLADGLSFDIFKLVNVSKPVIFVTAYNDYAIQAFKNNGIDYILKPFDDDEVEQALRKFNSLTSKPVRAQDNLIFEQLIRQINTNARPYKNAFLVHFRDKLIPVETEKIAWFYTANELVYAHTIDSRQYIVDFTMEQLEQQLDMNRFFRANRQFIVNRKEITEVAFYFNGRLVVKIKPDPPESIIISKARAPEFKNWMNN